MMKLKLMAVLQRLSCIQLCNLMDSCTPGFPVLHCGCPGIINTARNRPKLT